jgi:DNA-binding winged helix-turn-helix (wHTH) protein
LTTRINAVRRAVGDNGKAQRLIRTVPRKGLRFVGVAQQEQGPAEPAGARPLAPADSPRPAPAFPDKPSIA